MRVYIYDDVLPATEGFNRQAADIHNLHGQYPYLTDFLHHFTSLRTHIPEEADYFFIPLFMAGWQFMNLDPWDALKTMCPYMDRGRHMIVSTADVGQRAESKHEMQHSANPNRCYDKKYPWLDDRFILLTPESMPSLRPQDVAFLGYDLKERAAPRPRDLFLSFMGSMRHQYLPPEHIRGGRLYAWRDTIKDPGVIIGTPEEVRSRLGAVTFSEMIARSHHTLCPAGYGRWTFRFGEALHGKSIPVLLADDYVLPYPHAVRWSDYIYRFDEADLDHVLQRLYFSTEMHEKQDALHKDAKLFTKEFTLAEVTRCLQMKL